MTELKLRQLYYVCTECFHSMSFSQVHDQGRDECPKCHKGDMREIEPLQIPAPAIGTRLLCLVCAFYKPWGIFDISSGVSVCAECRDKVRVTDYSAKCAENDRLREALGKYQWVSVAERLPEPWSWDGKDFAMDDPPEYLVMMDGDRTVAEWEEALWVGFVGNDITKRVTHWMPFPSPPTATSSDMEADRKDKE